MATTSANDIITRSLVKARVISPGESIPHGKSSQVLEELNDLLESWALENLMVIADILESFSLTAGTSEYTYGEGGTFDSDRPNRIRDDCFIRSGSVDYPCELKSLDVYRRLHNKSTQGRPRIIAYNPEYPLAKVLLWPTPSSTDALHMRVAKVITTFPTGPTKIDLMPGYRRAIVANLALEISPNFGKKISDSLAFVADQSKRVIKTANSTTKMRTTPDLTDLLGGTRSGDILSGPY